MGFTKGFYHQRRSLTTKDRKVHRGNLRSSNLRVTSFPLWSMNSWSMNLEAITFSYVSISAKKVLEVARGLLRKSRIEFYFPRDRCGQQERESAVPCCRSCACVGR